MKPNWMIIGAAKAGSSSLAFGLATHPDVFLTDPKETHFFARDEEYAKGLEWYERHYDPAGDTPMRGEASNNYTMKEVWPHTIRRLADYTTDLKLIYIVRNPWERIPSWWVDCRSWGSGERAHHDFATALRENRGFLVDSTNYLAQIDAYREVFGDERILVVFVEDLNRDPDTVYRRCFEHLGVDAGHRVPREMAHINETGGRLMRSPLHSKLRQLGPYRLLSRMTPESWRSRARQWGPVAGVLTQAQAKPVWEEASVEYVRDVLAEPLAIFLQRYGKTADFWPASPARVATAV